MIKIYYGLNDLAKFTNSKELKRLLLTNNFMTLETHQRIINENKIIVEYPNGKIENHLKS